MEQIRPIKGHRNEIYVDSGGLGYRRGGLGIKRVFEVTSPTENLSILTSDAILPRPGMSAGYGGALNSITVHGNNKELHMSDIPGKVGGFPLLEGDRVITLSSGGGGYGDPLQRPVEWVKEDVDSGYVSVEGALSDYGVVMAENTVDIVRTEAARQRLNEERINVPITETHNDAYDEKGCRLIDISPDTAKSLGATHGSIVE